MTDGLNRIDSSQVRLGVDGQDDIIPEGLLFRHSDGSYHSQPEQVAKPRRTLRDRIAAVSASLNTLEKKFIATAASAAVGWGAGLMGMLNFYQSNGNALVDLGMAVGATFGAGGAAAVAGYAAANHLLKEKNLEEPEAAATDAPAAEPTEAAPTTDFDIPAPDAAEPVFDLSAADIVDPQAAAPVAAESTEDEAATEEAAEPEFKPSLAQRTRTGFMKRFNNVRNAIATSPVADIAHVLLKTDDAKAAVKDFSEKAQSTGAKIKGFFANRFKRNKAADVDANASEDGADTNANAAQANDAAETPDADAVETPKRSLLSRIGNVSANFAGAVGRAGKAIAKEWKTVLTTAGAVGATRLAVTGLAGLAGAPVLLSLATVTVTCGLVAGSLKTHAAYRKERQRLLGDNAKLDTANGKSFTSQDEVTQPTLTFREFMEQNKGLLSSNIAKSMAAATVGAFIGNAIHHIPGLFNGASADQALDHAQNAVAPRAPAAVAPVAPAAPAAPDFATAPLDQRLHIITESIQGEPNAYIANRLAQAGHGNAQALKDVAHALWNGQDGLAVDHERARLLFEQAAASGNRQAQTALEYIRSLPADGHAPTAPVAPAVADAPVAPRIAPVAPAVRAPSASFEGAFSDMGQPTDAASALAAAPAAPTFSTNCGLDVSNFNPYGDSMARFMPITPGAQCGAGYTAGANEMFRLQNGPVAIDVPMNQGETTNSFLSRVFQPASWNPIHDQLTRLRGTYESGQPITAADIGAGQTARLPNGELVSGPAADASSAVANDNGAAPIVAAVAAAPAMR